MVITFQQIIIMSATVSHRPFSEAATAIFLSRCLTKHVTPIFIAEPPSEEVCIYCNDFWFGHLLDQTRISIGQCPGLVNSKYVLLF